MFGTRGRLGPVDGHHVAEVPRDGPPHLTLVHDLLLRSDLENQDSNIETLDKLYDPLSPLPHKKSLVTL